MKAKVGQSKTLLKVQTEKKYLSAFHLLIMTKELIKRTNVYV